MHAEPVITNDRRLEALSTYRETYQKQTHLEQRTFKWSVFIVCLSALPSAQTCVTFPAPGEKRIALSGTMEAIMAHLMRQQISGFFSKKHPYNPTTMRLRS